VRLRKKPWAEAELASSPFFIENAEKYKGRWAEAFPEHMRGKPLHLEVGCGKCVQTSAQAHANRDVRLLAIDEVRKILAVGAREVLNAYGEDDVDNLRLCCADASELDGWLAAEDKVERIYISFPNPWTQRIKHHKRRLTHPRQLMQYREAMIDGGEIWFKTDDLELFEASKEYFPSCGFVITYLTDDLHASGFEPNFRSEHENKFAAQGMPIHMLIARKDKLPDDFVPPKQKNMRKREMKMNNQAINETRNLISFLEKSPTAFQAVAEISKKLTENGFEKLNEGAAWNIVPGGKYFITRNNTTAIAFRMPEKAPESVLVTASHTDSPTFKIKANPENEAFGKYVRLNTERYGGAILFSWMDRPLSVAGRVIVLKDGSFETKLVNIDKDLCVIPNVAPHMMRGLNDGFKPNPAVDMVPLMGEAASKGALKKMVAEQIGCAEEEIAAMDLYLYDRTGGRVWGANDEFYSVPRIDNMQCAYSTLVGFLNAKTSETALQVYAAFDNEETGSSTKQGAASNILLDLLNRACESQNVDLRAILASSFMLSADNGHAMHPNHPELSDRDNCPHMNGGVVIKYNASQRYTTDGISAAIFAEICKRAGVPTQSFANRSDLMGGGTLGSIANCRVAMNTVDIGLAQLAMHSCYETGGCADTLYMEQAVEAFYNTTITSTGDGNYAIK